MKVQILLGRLRGRIEPSPTHRRLSYLSHVLGNACYNVGMPYKDPNSEHAKATRKAYRQTKAYKQSKSNYQNSTAEKKRKYLNEIKAVPCMDCGQSYPPYVMDLDHRDPSQKIDGVSKMVKRGSWQAFLDEIDKCDVVCSNCHRERTHNPPTIAP